MIQYKCKEVGIEVKLVVESYTSKCSALDKEVIGKHDVYCGKREKRGLFATSTRQYINADINGSLNILRKGRGNDFDVSHKIFNPIRLTNMNELHDVAYFKWQPMNRGYVF